MKQYQQCLIYERRVLQIFSNASACYIFIILNRIIQLWMEDIIDEKIVFGEDLQCVSGDQLKTLQNRSIGSLRYNINGRAYVGSGTLVSPHYILTVAHNIYGRQKQCESNNVKFYLGADGWAERSYEVQSWRFPNEYKKCSQSQQFYYDYALLKLKEPIYFDKYLPLVQPCQSCLMQKNNQTQLAIFGFPGGGYKGNYQPLYGNKFRLYQYGLKRYGRIVSIQDSMINYSLSALGGESGTSICINQEIIGVLCAQPTYQKQQYNIGKLASTDMITNIKKWVRELKEAPFTIIPKRKCPHNKMAQESPKKQQPKKPFQPKNNPLPNQNIPQQIKAILQKTKDHEQLKLQSMNLQAIDVSKHSKLKYLQFNNNKLSTINLQGNPHLIRLHLHDNQIKEINLSNNPNLTEVWLSNNHIEKIDLSKNTNITELYVYNNRLTAIDLSKNINLIELNLYSNKLAAISLSKNTKLTQINLNGNILKDIDLTNNPKAAWLELQDNKLNSITLWHSYEVSLRLQNQRSKNCLVTLLHQKGDAYKNKCKQFGESKIQFYNTSFSLNKYECFYSFKMVERG